MKKTISFLLSLLLVLGMLPVGALATEDSTTVQPDESALTVYVNGKDVKEIEDDTISWNEETKTLTLNNANILAENGTYKGSGIYVIGSDTLVLELVGENTVEGQFNGRDESGNSVDDIFANAAISVTEGLTIRGDGSLTATDLTIGSDDKSNPIRSAGIFTGGDMTIESGTIHAVGNSSGYDHTASAGIFTGDYDSASTLSVSGGTVNATGTSNGIIAFNTIRISGGTVNATGENDTGLHVYNHILGGFGTTFISGGTVTLRGDGYSADTLLACSGYKNVMWTTVEGGSMNYNNVSNMAGMMSDYLRIEPADLWLVQPSVQNQYTTAVENLSGEEVAAEYRWYQEYSQPITSENVATAEVCTYDETTGLWTIPSAYEADNSMLSLAAAPGDIVTLEFQNPKEGILIAATNTALFEDLGGGVFTHTVTEEDFDPETGLFMMVIASEHELQVKISSAATEEVQTTSGHPNRFTCDAAGTYFCRATLTQNGTVKAVLDSGRFDYLPVNTVTFDPNGGTCETPSASTQEGLHTLAELPEATLTGYTFAGWFDAVEGGNRITTDTVITEDMTVYAQWTVNSYTLTVQGLSGILYEAQVEYGADLAAILAGIEVGDVTTEDGVYTFAGTFVLASEAQVPATMPADDLTVIAQYTQVGKQGVYAEDGGLFYYVNDSRHYAGLIEYNGGWIYVRSNGQLAVGRYWITKTNGNLPADSYLFDENGMLVEDSNLKNGVYAEDGGLFYYVDGNRTYAGLIKVDGEFYYVRSNGQLVTDRTYWITKTNDLAPADTYYFDAEGKMVPPYTPKAGVFEENGALYYYENGEICYGGLMQHTGSLTLEDGTVIDGVYDNAYIYVRSNGQLVVSRTYWTTKTNDNLPAANYQFDENGVMVN